MKEFDELLEVADRLLAPNGCPWDLKQNFFSLQPYILEEAHEVVEAVDSGDDQQIFEELGDLFYAIIFYSKLGEKEERFTIKDVVDSIKEKLIRRHPHIFGEKKIEDADEVIKQWDAIKKTEKAQAGRKSGIDGIPDKLSSLMRAQKVIKKLKKTHYPLAEKNSDDLGEKFLQLVIEAETKGIDCEGSLRRSLSALEQAFRLWEEKTSCN